LFLLGVLFFRLGVLLCCAAGFFLLLYGLLWLRFFLFLRGRFGFLIFLLVLLLGERRSCDAEAKDRTAVLITPTSFIGVASIIDSLLMPGLSLTASFL
jgi:hypothetical protein